MALVGWLDPATDFANWAEAPEPEDMALELETAFIKACEWAPKPLPDPAAAPANYKYAQRLLTQHLWARKKAGDGEGFGADGYMIQTYPLVREAYDAIRPKRGPLAGLL